MEVDVAAFAGMRGGYDDIGSLSQTQPIESLSQTQPGFGDDRQAILACTHARGDAQELAVTTASFKSGCVCCFCV